MTTYEFAIKISFLTFPIIAFLITIPYMIRQYRNYGSILFLRTIIVYSFILYLLTAYFMVILPLPTINETKLMTSSWVQLKPFNFIYEIKNYSGLVITNVNTYIPALKNPIIYTNLFNLILTIPFGIYLRYYFNRKWWETILLTLLLSLFFEITQLSGLYGIYPRPYRLFDIDDLIINTSGGLIGHITTPLFSFILPTRKRLDEISIERGKKVSYARRTLAFLIDCVIINIIATLLALFLNIELITHFYPFIYLLYFLTLTILLDGTTIGKSLVKIKIVDIQGTKAKIYQLMLRYTFFFIIFYQIYEIINFNKNNNIEIINKLSTIIYIMLAIIYFKTFIDIVSKKETLFYEKISKTKNISTIKLHKIEKKENEETN